MALQMSFTADDGKVYPNCYIPLVNVIVDPANAVVTVNYYADRAAFEAGDKPLQLWSYQTATAALVGNIIPAAYAYLLTLPEFAGAVEVP